MKDDVSQRTSRADGLEHETQRAGLSKDKFGAFGGAEQLTELASVGYYRHV